MVDIAAVILLRWRSYTSKKPPPLLLTPWRTPTFANSPVPHGQCQRCPEWWKCSKFSQMHNTIVYTHTHTYTHIYILHFTLVREGWWRLQYTTTNMLETYLSAQHSSLNAFMITKPRVSQKPCRRQLNTKVCSGKNAIFHYSFFVQTTLFNSGNWNTVHICVCHVYLICPWYDKFLTCTQVKGGKGPSILAIHIHLI